MKTHQLATLLAGRPYVNLFYDAAAEAQASFLERGY